MSEESMKPLAPYVCMEVIAADQLMERTNGQGWVLLRVLPETGLEEYQEEMPAPNSYNGKMHVTKRHPITTHRYLMGKLHHSEALATLQNEIAEWRQQYQDAQKRLFESDTKLRDAEKAKNEAVHKVTKDRDEWKQAFENEQRIRISTQTEQTRLLKAMSEERDKAVAGAETTAKAFARVRAALGELRMKEILEG